MTTSQPQATVTAREVAIEETVRVAMLELLLSPEVGRRFLTEIMKDNGGYVSDVTIETVEEMVHLRLREMATPVFEGLTGERNIDVYGSLI